MASLHKQAGKPNWFASFRDHAGRQHFKSTGTTNRKQAQAIADGWQKAADLARQQNLSRDRARKLITQTVGDVLEAGGNGLAPDTLKQFFIKAADLVGRGQASKEQFQKLIGATVGEVVTAAGGDLPTVTIREWCDRWLESKSLEAEPRTHERYATSLRRFKKFMGAKVGRNLVTLTADDVIRFRDTVAKQLSVTSTNMDLKVLRACLYAAVRQDLLEKNVAAHVATLKQRGESKRRAFTLAEVRRILSRCDEAGGEWRGLVLTAVYTGQRLGDIATLTWTQLDLAKGEISFVTQKTAKRLCLALAKPLRAYFESLPGVDDPKAFVFPNAAAAAEKHTGTISTKFYDEILAPAGLVPVRPRKDYGRKDRSRVKGRDAKRIQSELSFHSFRHTMTTWLKTTGASHALAQLVVGHDSEVVSRGYTHLSSADTADAIARLPDATKP
jgi:integrase